MVMIHRWSSTAQQGNFIPSEYFLTLAARYRTFSEPGQALTIRAVGSTARCIALRVSMIRRAVCPSFV